jgi:hypothetical protein
MGEITVNGQVLAIKPHRKGNRLQATKRELNDRKVFVRIVSKNLIKLNLKGCFSEFGRVESAYLIESSQRLQEGNYTIIGYALFEQYEVVQKLLKMKRLKRNNCEFQLRKVQDRDIPKGRNAKAQK